MVNGESIHGLILIGGKALRDKPFPSSPRCRTQSITSLIERVQLAPVKFPSRFSSTAAMASR